MAIRFDKQIVFKEDGGQRAALSDSDIGRELVDTVVEAYKERRYDGLAPFRPGQEDFFDKIGQTNYLGIYLENPEGKMYKNFAFDTLSLLGHFEGL